MTETTKTVCIVGAGPAGLVTAKTFMQQGGFSITVYEAADRVGGMWRAQPGEQGDKCSPEMRTNLSKYTVAFSDLSWSSVDLSGPEIGPTSSSPPMFPKAWQVGRYLETYKNQFHLHTSIRLNKRVVRACPKNVNQKWSVVTEDTRTKKSETCRFDYLIVASGFFGGPGRSFSPSSVRETYNIQHSSRFRDLSALTNVAGKIVVVGGSISGSEAAAQAAFQISNAKHCPGESGSIHANSKIYHILNRPFYCLPRYLPQDFHHSEIRDSNFAPKFLPLDFVLYDLSRKSAGDISASITAVPEEIAQKGHDFIRSLIGGNQRDLGYPELVYESQLMKYPAYVGLVDTYAEFVRSGIIVPVKGWVNKVERQGQSGLLDIQVHQHEPWYHSSSKPAASKDIISDVAGMIEATGYTDRLDYLESVKSLLHFDPSCSRIPFLLTRGSMLAEISTIGFVGFYEGPFWGVMEMQAHFIASTWAKYATDWATRPKTDLYEHNVTERMRQLIKSDSALQVPQFWMADYVGLVEELAREVGLARDDSSFDGRSGPVFPSRYQGAGTGPEAATIAEEVAGMIKSSRDETRFVTPAVFTGLQGIWKLRRKIVSRRSASFSGTFLGTAHFHPRAPTLPMYAAEYLYIEEGTLTIGDNHSSLATRRYVYRFDEATDKISAWFTAEDGKSAGALFNTWDIYAPEDDHHGWMAKGYHWCDSDTYRSSCEFRFRGASLNRFGIVYDVEGPDKAYVHESWYERPSAGCK